MKVLMINKFLYPNGGSETYIFKLGDYLKSQGHEVQYFGMEHERRCVSNRVDAYTSNMDFHNGSKLSKLLLPIKTIYSSEARKKIRLVLDDFQPDVCHINNFNYQLTPSIILEIDEWRKKNNKKCRILYTAHDYQLVCPNHMCRNPQSDVNCEKCLTGSSFNCTKGKCIHGSTAKSLIGTAEATFWKFMNVYEKIDTIICCSNFMKTKLDTNPVLAKKTIALHNFIELIEDKEVEKKDYVLYFGRYSKEKGVETLVEACKRLPQFNFIFAGSGPLENIVNNVPNIKNVGFQTGKDLEMLVREAKLTFCPSTVYENCPFSVLESISYGTPVLGANIGGIPELISVGVTGDLFESGNVEDLKNKLLNLLEDENNLKDYANNCKQVKFDTISEYCEKMMMYYE